MVYMPFVDSQHHVLQWSARGIRGVFTEICIEHHVVTGLDNLVIVTVCSCGQLCNRGVRELRECEACDVRSDRLSCGGQKEAPSCDAAPVKIRLKAPAPLATLQS